MPGPVAAGKNFLNADCSGDEEAKDEIGNNYKNSRYNKRSQKANKVSEGKKNQPTHNDEDKNSEEIRINHNSNIA